MTQKEKSTETKILQTAMTIFVKKGRHGAKMQEIADQAGINKALLHYYFRTKDKLYLKVFENVFAESFGALHTVFQSQERFSVKLTEFVDQYTSLILKNPQIPMFILRELSEGASDIKPVFNQVMQERKFNLPSVFIEHIQLAVQKGEIRKMDPRQVFITIIGSVAFFFIAEPLLTVFLKNDPSYKREAFIEQRKKAIIDIILNGIKPQDKL